MLLSGAAVDFVCDPARGEEVFDPSLPVDQALIQVAIAKAREVYTRHPQASVLAADTIVCDGSKILGKPADPAEAAAVLASLSGRWHEVKTAVVVMKNDSLRAQSFTTRVHFRDLSQQEIEAYAHSGRPLDKAGSYGIQEVDFCDRLEGSCCNVIGLPVEQIIDWI